MIKFFGEVVNGKISYIWLSQNNNHIYFESIYDLWYHFYAKSGMIIYLLPFSKVLIFSAQEGDHVTSYMIDRKRMMVSYRRCYKPRSISRSIVTNTFSSFMTPVQQHIWTHGYWTRIWTQSATRSPRQNCASLSNHRDSNL